MDSLIPYTPIIFGGLVIVAGYSIYNKTTNYIEDINYKTIGLVAGIPVLFFIYTMRQRDS